MGQHKVVGRLAQHQLIPQAQVFLVGVDFKDLDTSTTTLEDIFVDLVGRAA